MDSSLVCSGEASVGVFVGFSHFCELLELEPGCEDAADDDCSEVAVELPAKTVNDVLFALLGHLKFVGETASIKRNSTEEEIGSHEGGHDDEHVIVDEEGEDCCRNGASNGDHPEEGRAACKVEHSLVQESSEEETAPACENGRTHSLDLHHEEAGEAANKHTRGENCPAHPRFSVRLQESSIEDNQNE